MFGSALFIISFIFALIAFAAMIEEGLEMFRRIAKGE